MVGLSEAPVYQLDFEDQIQCFTISEGDFSSNLICVANQEKFNLGLFYFPEETDIGNYHWQLLKEIYHVNHCYALCFAPETNLSHKPKPIVTFCAAESDYSLRIIRTDLQDSDTEQILKGHKSYVNDIAWDYEGEYLASVSDDFSCRLWVSKANYENIITFCLSSAGMSVKWHPEEPQKLLIAEKRGIIRLYNVVTSQAILSIEAPKFPLMSMDWSLSNRLCIAAGAGGDIITWDLQIGLEPIDIKQAHEDCARLVKFSPKSEMIVASIGRPNVTLKVHTPKSNVPVIEAPLKLYGHICWHQRLSYVAVSNDRNICFWKVQIK